MSPLLSWHFSSLCCCVTAWGALSPLKVCPGTALPPELGQVARGWGYGGPSRRAPGWRGQIAEPRLSLLGPCPGFPPAPGSCLQLGGVLARRRRLRRGAALSLRPRNPAPLRDGPRNPFFVAEARAAPGRFGSLPLSFP